MQKFCYFLLIFSFGLAPSSQAQFIMDMFDNTDSGTKRSFYSDKIFDHVRISGYLQPQFQIAQSKGISSYSGGDFAANVDNRFMVRRGRIKIDYASFTQDDFPYLHLVFQLNGSEKGVEIRDFRGSIYENKFNMFSLTAGMFARPFGYEINLSSSDRESPERGRMSQILMKGERDLGAMLSFEPQRKEHPLRYLKIDAGLFNGQGLTAPGDFDSYKDFISRISVKPFPVSKFVSISGGLSHFEGGFIQNNKFIYKMHTAANPSYVLDSSSSNLNKKAPRIYSSADLQLKFKSKIGITELRGEYWMGKQTSTSESSVTPKVLLDEPYFIREFNGAFFYLLHKFNNSKHQLGLKYDWYDPNIKISGKEIGSVYSNANATDIKYSTLGFGYLFYFNKHSKLVLWYDVVKNENTLLPDYKSNVKDNVFTCRLQFKF